MKDPLDREFQMCSYDIIGIIYSPTQMCMLKKRLSNTGHWISSVCYELF